MARNGRDRKKHMYKYGFFVTLSLSISFLFTSTSFSENRNLVLAGLFGPSSYEDCILESMKNVQSDRAAASIQRACRKKFPKKKVPQKKVIKKKVTKKGMDPQEFERMMEKALYGNRPIKLSQDVVSKLTGKGRKATYSAEYTGNIHNSSTVYQITEVTIRITPWSPKDKTYKLELSKDYKFSKNIPPLTNVGFTISADVNNRDYLYVMRIINAWGYKK